MAVFKTLAFLFVLCFEIHHPMAAEDANSSFLFDGFVKSPSFDENVALFGDSKLLNGGPSIQLTDSASRSEGRVVYRTPIRLFQGKERNFSGSFSTSFSFSMSSEIGSVLAFVMVPSGLDLSSFGRKGNNSSSGLSFLLQHKVVAVAFGISRKGNRVGILVGKPESGKIRKLSSFGDHFNGEKKFNCWIDYEASSKRIEVRLSLSTALKPVDPFVSYLVDLAKLWKDGKFMVGLTSANGNSSKPLYLHSWTFKLRHPSMRIHSQPLDPNEVSKTVKEGETTVEEVKGKRRCIWRMLGALVLGAVCGTLGAMLALYLWTICGNRQSMAIVPEECANEKSDNSVIKTDVVQEEGKK
ncbi:hypothetical protein CARUB_v10001288mg [Capsella rubella]|uniref:Legume lectin domain-containing protein n=1 Tax=Capsella rubella TaxID=81985 RepID=R0FG85_9BRAS|nr:L-type lectin-domain containing receptor kinase IV.2 [Capsella rubella]EOA20956.1 hypothetical protein CARUB_v10001288mg [Capsella rubella]